MGLRSAGFAAEWVLRLAAPACREAADQVLEVEEAERRARHALRQALDAAIKDCRRELQGRAGQDDDLQREIRNLKKTAQRLNLGRPIDQPNTPRIDRRLTDHLAELHARLASSRRRFADAFETCAAQSALTIREMASQPRFREAVTWQNRRAIHGSIAALLRQPPGAPGYQAQQRKSELLIASYIQRYTVKNDSIGFFGPFGWAKAVSQAQPLMLTPGSTLLTARRVYFEDWTIHTLAETLTQDPQLLPWLAPRRLPSLYVENDRLHLPFCPPTRLPALQAAILRACDGHRPACDIARQLLSQPELGLRTDSQVYQTLAALRTARRIAWSIDISLENLHPEQHLKRQLTAIEDGPRRRAALDALEELEAARAAVAEAAGDAARLDEALANLETTFARLTGAAPTRQDGQMYAGRTLVYEDCRRDVELTLGPDVLAAFGPPLTLLLESARWFTWQVAQRYRAAFRSTFEAVRQQLKRGAEEPEVDMASFWLWCQPLLAEQGAGPVAEVLAEFQRRWEEILNIPADERSVTYHSQALREAVTAAFHAPRPGWRDAWYHSPDVMISASSVEAIARGEYQLVLGELHMGVNALNLACFLAQHPAPEELLQATASDLPAPRVRPLLSRESGGDSRTRFAAFLPDDVRILFAHDACVAPGVEGVTIGELVVVDQAGELIVRTRDARQSFDLINFFSHLLSLVALNSFKPLAPRPHTPRIAIDRLVVSREAWRFAAETLTFAFETDEAERFLAARRWQRAHGLPRFVFVKTPDEPKPCYVDFDSPIYVSLLSKWVRLAAGADGAPGWIGLTEMLPNLDQLWLSDAAGQRYTSELRLVALDPA